jgi:hypothetical protein
VGWGLGNDFKHTSIFDSVYVEVAIQGKNASQMQHFSGGNQGSIRQVQWTLQQGLGERFTPEVKEAWTSAYTLLADTMRAAAADAQQETMEAAVVFLGSPARQ